MEVTAFGKRLILKSYLNILSFSLWGPWSINIGQAEITWADISCLFLMCWVVLCGKELPHGFGCVFWGGFYIFGGGVSLCFFEIYHEIQNLQFLCSSKRSDHCTCPIILFYSNFVLLLPINKHHIKMLIWHSEKHGVSHLEKVFPGAMITSDEISAPIIFNEEKILVRSLYHDTFLASNY